MKKFYYGIVIFFVFFINIDIYAAKINVKFSKCVDGDTAKIILKKEEIKIRFLGINTPESVHPTKDVEAFGKESSKYTCKKLTNAKQIQIEYDPKSSKTDRYGRHLVWVFVDGLLLQKDIISKGYAEVAYLYGKYLYVDDLKAAEQKAKDKKVGVWSLTEEQRNSQKTSSKTSSSSAKNSKNDSELDVFSGLLNSIYEILKKIFDLFKKIVDAVV